MLAYGILIYLIIINAAAFCLMGADKYKARRGLYRIPEKTLFLAALLGGSAGAWIGMYTFRHKTRHWYFVVGIPAVFLVQVGLAGFVYK